MDSALKIKGVAFARYAIARAATGTETDAVDFAAARWGAGSVPARIIKAAIGASGGELSDLQSAAYEFFSLVREASVFGQMNFRRVPLRVRTMLQTAGAAGYWVPEGAAKRMSAPTYSEDTLHPRKVASLIVVTEETLRHAGPEGEAIVRNDLLNAVVDTIDGTLLSAAAAVAGQSPAGLANGVTAIPSIGEWAEVQQRADLERMVRSFQGDLTKAVWVARPQVFASLASPANPNIGIRGGELLGAPAIASRNVPNDADGNGKLMLIDPSGIAAGYDPATSLETASEATILMDSAPGMSAITPQAAQQVSLFQTNSRAILAEQAMNWKVVRPGSVAVLDGIISGGPLS